MSPLKSIITTPFFTRLTQRTSARVDDECLDNEGEYETTFHVDACACEFQPRAPGRYGADGAQRGCAGDRAQLPYATAHVRRRELAEARRRRTSAPPCRRTRTT